MKVVVASVAMVTVCAAGIVLAQSDTSKNTGANNKSPELRQLGKHLAKGQADQHAGSYGGSNPLLFHAGGTVVSSTTEVHPIYWGPKWADSAFVNDKIAGLALFYAGASSHYLSTNTEYTGSTGLHTADLIVEPDPEHPYIDSAHAAPTGDVQPIAVLNEVCSVVGSDVKRHAYYPVYVDSPRGSVGYCAYHSSGTCANGTPVDFAFFLTSTATEAAIRSTPRPGIVKVSRRSRTSRGTSCRNGRRIPSAMPGSTDSGTRTRTSARGRSAPAR